jgi:hypothetical protein
MFSTACVMARSMLSTSAWALDAPQSRRHQMTHRSKALLGAFLTATALGTGAVAYAQTAGSPWDASQLPETRGIVKQYTLTPRGDVDGIILNDGTEVTLPPHLTSQIVFAIRPGDAVTIRGLKARALPLVEAASVTNFATGASVVDNGPPDGPDRFAGELTTSGRVAAPLHGKRGEVNGAVLDSGIILRMPPPEAERVQGLLQPGQPVTVRGATLKTALGTVIEANAIGASPDQLTELGAGPRPVGPRGEPRRGPVGPPDFGLPPPRPPRG